MLKGGEHQASGVLVEVAREELGWVYCVLMALSAKLLSTLASRNLRRAISSVPRPWNPEVVVFWHLPIPTGWTGGLGVGGPTLCLVDQDGSCRSCIDDNCKHFQNEFC